MLLNVTDLNVKIKSLKSVLTSGGGILCQKTTDYIIYVVLCS